MPSGIIALNTDNDSAFINETVLDYCNASGIAFSRARPYRKNDQAWIEQKNGAIVRRLVGYQRFQGLHAVRILTTLYDSARLLVNYFLPSFKLAETARNGARVSKRYYPPATPCDRLLTNAAVTEPVKQMLLEVRQTLDPVDLLSTIRAAQRELLELDLEADRTVTTTDEFLREVTKLWRNGERQLTRAKRASPRAWRTRADPFATAWADVETWLDSEPDLTAKEAMQRLIDDGTHDVKANQLRTLQRRVQVWRSARAVDLIRAAG